MREIFFCIKTMILTIAIVIVMQVQVGDRTLESHAMGWVQSSPLVMPLNSVANGAAKMIGEMTDKAKAQIQHLKRKVSKSF